MRIEKYGAEWCGPCQVMDRTLANFQSKHPEVSVKFIDVDEEEELTKSMNIRSIPVTVIYNDNNVEIKRYVGIVSENELELNLLQCLKSI